MSGGAVRGIDDEVYVGRIPPPILDVQLPVIALRKVIKSTLRVFFFNCTF